MTYKLRNLIRTQLAADITIGAAALTVTTGDGALFDDLGVGDSCDILVTDGSNNEYMRITARSADTLTIGARPIDGTTAQAWVAGAIIERRLNKGMLEGKLAEEIAAAVAALPPRQTVISYTGTGGITSKGAVLTKTPCTVIPRDGSLPQNTEGDAVLDVTITPSIAGAVIDIEFGVAVENESGANMIFVAAVFRDTTADAEYVVPTNITTGFALLVTGSHRITAADTTPITFKLRGGTATAQNLTYNSGSAATYGAVCNSYIKATEVGYT